MAAALAPPSHTASARSGLPLALMPAVTADQRKPSGRSGRDEGERLDTISLYQGVPFRAAEIKRSRGTERRSSSALPSFCAAESLQAYVSPEPQFVSAAHHKSAVGLAGLWVVQLAAGGMVRVRQMEALADRQSTERTITQSL